MKKLATIAIAVAMGGTLMLQSGCYGSFALTKKLYDWNGSVSNDKFVKSLVFWALMIIPVYGVASLVDAVILNLIEFWTGSNPVSMQPGQHEEQLVTKGGVTYRMVATKNRFTITPMNGPKKGQPVQLNFDEREMSWSYDANGTHTQLARIEQNSDGGFVAALRSGMQTIRIAAPQTEQDAVAAIQAARQYQSTAQR